MAGEASKWMENLAGYLEPVVKAAVQMKEQVTGAIETYDFPPAVIDAYKSGTATMESYGVEPAYVGAGIAVATSGLLLLACGCFADPKKSKGLSYSKKKKSKPAKSTSAVTTNGVPHKNGGSGGSSGTSGATVVAAPGGRVLPAGTGGKTGTAAGGADKAAGSAKVVKPKKEGAEVVQQATGKGKGKVAAEAPPVITEEPEAAKKRIRKKEAKKKAAKEAKAVAAAASPAPKKSGEERGVAKGSSTVANGSSKGIGTSRASGHKGGDAGGGDPHGGQQAGGEWQTSHNMGLPEGEWETVSHKKTKPRKDRTAAANDANAIPGGLGL